jgi:ribosomal protein S18 acetylase RimI-like enzyme
MNYIALRDEPGPGDGAAIRHLAETAGVFSPAEVAIAREVIEERLARGLAATGYHFLFAEEGRNQPLGYACFGPIPLTLASWDLYWIAVDPQRRGRGIGRRLMAGVERRVAAAGAAALFIDTSGRSDYGAARAFYASLGYSIAAEFPDFYSPGDAKVVFRKSL